MEEPQNTPLSKPKPKHTVKDVKKLGRQLLSSRSYINNLPLLLTYISPSEDIPPQYVLESLLFLQSFFTPLLPHLPASSPASARVVPRTSDIKDGDAEVIYRTWLRAKFDEFVKLLVQVVVSTHVDDALRELVLDALMEFVKVGNGGKFHSAIYHKLLVNLVNLATPDNFILDSLVSKYFNYIDVSYFTFISLEKLARNLEANDLSDHKNEAVNMAEKNNAKERVELSIWKLHYIISRIPPLDQKEKDEYEMWSVSGTADELSLPEKAKDEQTSSGKHNKSVLSGGNMAKKMKLKFTKAWLAFLRLPLPLDVYKEVLATLHEAVIPHLSNPVILSDFLTRSYDIGGVVSVMALSSLFILMTQHGLEYSNFYEKLYALLNPSIFLAKHRAKFFQLLDSCLKSPLLPAYLAAAFAKKLSRLTLTVPPSGELVIIALIHNLLRRHPSINCLVHRESGNGTADDSSEVDKKNVTNAKDTENGMEVPKRKAGIDHFNNDEKNPAKSNALRSSLWEIETLRNHYCPPVSRFVQSLENDLTVRSKTTEVNIKDFSSSSYATVFGEEIRRRIKQVPLAFYKATPTCLFSESDFAGWTFKCEESIQNSEENGLSGKRRRVEAQ